MLSSFPTISEHRLSSQKPMARNSIGRKLGIREEPEQVLTGF